MALQCGAATQAATVGAFLPSFIHEFGYGPRTSAIHYRDVFIANAFCPVKSQLFSVIPYACAFVTLLGVSYLSDHLNKKGVLLMCTLSISILGYASYPLFIKPGAV
jgi:hypothetical protein